MASTDDDRPRAPTPFDELVGIQVTFDKVRRTNVYELGNPVWKLRERGIKVTL